MFPRLLQIGGFTLHTYGLLVALGFGAGLWMAIRLGRRRGLPADRLFDLGIYVALAAVAGSKLLLIVEDWKYYNTHPGEIFSMATLQAAGVFYGGFLAALATAVWYVRKHGLPFLEIADAFVPGVALGHAIGRWGCFASGCCWGRECHLPWAVTFTDPYANQLVGVPLNVPMHPAQLYESAALLVIFGILLFMAGRRSFPGQLLSLYLMLYGVARFLLEYTRDRAGTAMPLGLVSLSQLIALLMIPAGLVVWIKCRPVASHQHA